MDESKESLEAIFGKLGFDPDPNAEEDESEEKEETKKKLEDIFSSYHEDQKARSGREEPEKLTYAEKKPRRKTTLKTVVTKDGKKYIKTYQDVTDEISEENTEEIDPAIERMLRNRF